MSIASKSEFDKLLCSIENLQQTLTLESKNVENKIILSCAKIDYLEERVEEGKNIKSDFGQLERLKGDLAKLKKCMDRNVEKYMKDLDDKKSEFQRQIVEINKNVKISKDNRTREFKALEEKLDGELHEITVEFVTKNEKQKHEINVLQQKLLKQFQNCEQQIFKTRKNVIENEQNISQKIQSLQTELQGSIRKLKQTRRTKKMNFLELLENVIGKLKEVETVKF